MARKESRLLMTSTVSPTEEQASMDSLLNCFQHNHQGMRSLLYQVEHGICLGVMTPSAPALIVRRATTSSNARRRRIFDSTIINNETGEPVDAVSLAETSTVPYVPHSPGGTTKDGIESAALALPHLPTSS